MSDDYIHKDVVDEMRRTFEARLAEYEAKIAKQAASLKHAFELQRVKNKADIEAVADAVSEVRRRMDDLKDFVTWGLTVLGVSVAVVGLVISAVQLFAKK